MSKSELRPVAIFVALFLATLVALVIFIAILNALATIGHGSPVVS